MTSMAVIIAATDASDAPGACALTASTMGTKLEGLERDCAISGVLLESTLTKTTPSPTISVTVTVSPSDRTPSV